MIIGYTAGVFDLFHHGHVNLLKNAKALCDRLIVGVSTDALVEYKGKRPIIPHEHRMTVVNSCKYVDLTIPQENIDKFEAYKKLKFDVLIVGSDWYEDKNWISFEEKLNLYNVKIRYIPYTNSVSSTLINNILTEKRFEKNL